MQKLITCDRNNFQFQPNVSAVSRKISVIPPLLAAISTFIREFADAKSFSLPRRN